MTDISHPEKTLFPHAGIEKRQLAAYWGRDAEWALPHLRQRPLTLRVFPRGIDEDGFFLKNASRALERALSCADIPLKANPRQTVRMVLARSVDDFVTLANQNVIEIHHALSSADNPDQADQIVIDFDPADGDFAKVRRCVRGLLERLDPSGLPVFLKSTGSRGIHAHLPLASKRRFDETREVARRLAERLEAELPEIATTAARKTKRGDKVYLDTARNAYGQTCIAPYSPRARKGAPVATPIDRRDLHRPDYHPRRYRIDNLFRRLAHKRDPWRDWHEKSASWKKLSQIAAE